MFRLAAEVHGQTMSQQQQQPRLELTNDMFEKILEHLPPPAPKIVPCVRIVRIGKHKWSVSMSKGCTEEEIKAIGESWLRSVLAEGSASADLIWHARWECCYESVRFIMTQCMALGYELESCRVDPRQHIMHARGQPCLEYIFLARRR